MEFSTVQNNDILKTNRFPIYVHGKINDIFEIDKNRKIKSTPRKCKMNLIQKNEGKMKKSSSLHNIEKLGIKNNEIKEKINTSSININRNIDLIKKNEINENNEFFSEIKKDKKSYESTISELILSVETRKKEKEIFLLENKRLTETVQNLQMDIGKWRDLNGKMRVKMREFGVEIGELFEFNEVIGVIDASGDCGAHCSVNSLTLATLGDTSSVISDEWPTIEDNGESARDFLDTLSVSTLQDRIQKMEEDSYCTNEELQATMQELTDLQHNLDSINDDNRNLTFEREVLLQSLCEQTLKLQRCRLLSDNLKFLLLNNNLNDYPNMDLKLRELYLICVEDNKNLVIQNEEFKHTIMSCQSELRQLSIDITEINQQLFNEQIKYSQLEEKYRDELWQREQVENVLKNHSEIFGKTIGWTDCSSGVLALIQQSKSQKQTEINLKLELLEKINNIEVLTSQIKQLEEGMQQGIKNKEEHKGSIEQLTTQLMKSETEIYILSQTLDTQTQKFADDFVSWRSFERDLLTAIDAANSLKDDRDKDLQEIEKKLEASEKIRKQLLEKIESQKNSITSQQTKDRVIVSRELSNTNSVKTLIQSLEYQMKPGAAVIKPCAVVPCSNLSSGINTVPRLSISSKSTKKEIIRTNTVKCETSPPKMIPENSLQKSSSFKNETPQKPILPISESNQVLLQPLTTVVSQASSILQSVSRRNSVVTNTMLENHSQAPSPTKLAAPVPASTDLLAELVKTTKKGSKRNALLFWCQTKTSGYQKIDITNFSSSWNDGLAFCALFHSYAPGLVNFKKLAEATSTNPDKSQKKINFQAAFLAANELGISNSLNIETMINVERPDWNSVMNFVVEIYLYFESQQSLWRPALSD